MYSTQTKRSGEDKYSKLSSAQPVESNKACEIKYNKCRQSHPLTLSTVCDTKRSGEAVYIRRNKRSNLNTCNNRCKYINCSKNCRCKKSKHNQALQGQKE